MLAPHTEAVANTKTANVHMLIRLMIGFLLFSIGLEENIGAAKVDYMRKTCGKRAESLRRVFNPAKKCQAPHCGFVGPAQRGVDEDQNPERNPRRRCCQLNHLPTASPRRSACRLA
jgi:hypothetical protein